MSNTYAVKAVVFEQCNPLERREIAMIAGLATVDTPEEAREFTVELINENFGDEVDVEVQVVLVSEVTQ